MRNRLEGEAAVYKRVLDRDALKANDPPGAGVDYFKRVLRPYFVKGATNVFLHRFLQFVRFNRGSADMMKWMTRFQILLQRLMSSWMDMLEPVTQAHPQVQAQMQADAMMNGVAPTAERIQEIMQNINGNLRTFHQNDFPLGENLIALLMLSLADLSQDQRNTLTSLMTHRGRVLQQYTTTELRTVFIEMFCTTKTSVDNPLMQPTGAGGRRSFLVFEEGELDGTYGFWAEDEEDGIEGFLDALDDVFWVYDEQNFSWFQRRFQGRRARKGKGKGRRKGKGKGRSGRRFFRPRGKGKGGKKRGKGHYADEQPPTYPDEYFEENPYEDTWESNQVAYDAILAEDMNDYLQGEHEDAYDFWQQLEEAWFSHKGKGKGKRKGKKGKGKDKGDGKQDANYANQQQPRSLPAPSRSSQASGSHQGFFAHCVTTAAEVHDSEVNLLSGMMTSCQDEADCKVNNGEMIFDGMSAPVRYSLSKEMLTSAPDGFALMSAEEEVKETQAISFLTENRFPPTIAILDIGCTRAMGSRRAVDYFCNYVDSHPSCGLWYSFEATKSKFYFANSQKASCSQKLVIYMYDRAWAIHNTEFDIVEEGEVPLLMSLPQMRNLGFELRLTPQHAYLTSVPLGIKHLELKVAASTHLVLDFQDIAWYLSDVRLQAQREKSFYSHFIHYEYGHISVDHNSDEDEAEHAYPVVDYWEVDVHKRELIRHHKDYRKILFPATKSCPVDTDLLEDLRLTIIKKKEGGEEIKKLDDGARQNGRTYKLAMNGVVEQFLSSSQMPKFQILRSGRLALITVALVIPMQWCAPPQRRFPLQRTGNQASLQRRKVYHPVPRKSLCSQSFGIPPRVMIHFGKDTS